jgi:hypothetical protein
MLGQLLLTASTIRSSNLGPADSFQLTLNVDVLDSFQTSDKKSIGVLIALFPFDYPTPLVSHIGFTVPIGFESSVALRSEFVERLSKYKKGECDPDATSVLFEKYSTAGCYLENRFMRVVNACSCLPYNFPEYRNELDESNFTQYLQRFQPCSIEMQYTCAEKVWKETDAVELENLTCPDACESQRYEHSITYATIAGNQLQASVHKDQAERIDSSYLKAIHARHNTSSLNGTPKDDYIK